MATTPYMTLASNVFNTLNIPYAQLTNNKEIEMSEITLFMDKVGGNIPGYVKVTFEPDDYEGWVRMYVSYELSLNHWNCGSIGVYSLLSEGDVNYAVETINHKTKLANESYKKVNKTINKLYDELSPIESEMLKSMVA